MKNCYGKVQAEYGNMCENICYKFRKQWVPWSYLKPSKYIRKLYAKQQRKQAKVAASFHMR